MPKNGLLYYRKRRVNPQTFNPERKDLLQLLGYCTACGDQVVGSDAIPHPDPFASEMQDDNTLVVQCDACDKLSNDET